jgi:hypothetical protein
MDWYCMFLYVLGASRLTLSPGRAAGLGCICYLGSERWDLRSRSSLVDLRWMLGSSAILVGVYTVISPSRHAAEDPMCWSLAINKIQDRVQSQTSAMFFSVR